MENYNNFTVNDSRSVTEVLLIRYQQALQEKQEIERRQAELAEQQRMAQQQYEEQIQEETEQLAQQNAELATEIEKTREFMESVITAKLACECGNTALGAYGERGTPLEGHYVGGVASIYPSCEDVAKAYVPLAVANNIVHKADNGLSINQESGFFVYQTDARTVTKGFLQDRDILGSIEKVKEFYQLNSNVHNSCGTMTIGDVVKAIDDVCDRYAEKGFDLRDINKQYITTELLTKKMYTNNDRDMAESLNQSRDLYYIPENATKRISVQSFTLGATYGNYDNIIMAGKAAEMYLAGVQSSDKEFIQNKFPYMSSVEQQAMSETIKSFEEYGGVTKDAVKHAETAMKNQGMDIYISESRQNYAVGVSKSNIERYQQEYATVKSNINTEKTVDKSGLGKEVTLDATRAMENPEKFDFIKDKPNTPITETYEVKSLKMPATEVAQKYRDVLNDIADTEWVRQAEQVTGRDINNDGKIEGSKSVSKQSWDIEK